MTTRDALVELRAELQKVYDDPGFAASPDYYGGLGRAIDAIDRRLADQPASTEAGEALVNDLDTIVGSEPLDSRADG